ncbi:ABC transporter permease [Nocardia sp. NPDC050630]|uniref:ABC transporter permease n=1 Tax=Nocardia sp. NPDC050630 TaxID=3364321 RepID=UPI0037AF9478
MAVLVLWQCVVGRWVPDYLPTPTGTVLAAPRVLISSLFTEALWPSLLAIVTGLPIGFLVGTVLGLVTGRVWWLRSLVLPYTSGLYAVPLLALVPMVTIWLGYTSDARLFVVILSALLPAAVSASDGAQSVPIQLVDAAIVLRVPCWRFALDVVLPSSLPYIVAGAQVAIGRALVGLVAVEFLTNIPGIGTYILTQARSFHQNDAFVAVALVALTGIAIRALCQFAVGRIRWSSHVGG